jgi:hypothetical protein
LRDRVAELERELSALRQPAPAEPARVPVAVGQVRRGERWLNWTVTNYRALAPSSDHPLVPSDSVCTLRSGDLSIQRLASEVELWELVTESPEVEPAQGDARDPAADPQIGDAWVRGWERRTVEAVKRVDGHEVRVVFSGGVTPTPISVWIKDGWSPEGRKPAQGDGGAR